MNDLRLLAGFALILFCLSGCNQSQPASPIVQKVETLVPDLLQGFLRTAWNSGSGNIATWPKKLTACVHR